MRQKLLAACAAALALVMALTCLPSALVKTASAAIEPCWTVPSGYNAHDYNKCAAFLEQTDENGVKNGTKLSENYNANVPSTWGTYWDYDDNGNYTQLPRFAWEIAGGELRIVRIDIFDHDYTDTWHTVGTLDASGCTALEYLDCGGNFLTGLNVGGCAALHHLDCWGNFLTEVDVSGNAALQYMDCDYNDLTELNVSGCTGLRFLYCYANDLTELNVSSCASLYNLGCWSNALTELDVSGNTALFELDCDYNSITELDVSRNTALEYLYCGDNALTELDVSRNIALGFLYCGGNALTELDVSRNTGLWGLSCDNNALTELDLSNNPYLAPDFVRAEGSGTIGYDFINWYDVNQTEGYVYACPNDGTPFLGWYNAAGVLLSEDEVFDISGTTETELIARFEEAQFILGDADGNGVVTANDALMVLRAALGLVSDVGPAGDVDGNGVVTANDALMILRAALGIITL